MPRSKAVATKTESEVPPKRSTRGKQKKEPVDEE